VILFWLVCTWMIVSTFVFVFLPARAPSQSNAGNATTGANIDVYRNQFAELESELRHQRITRAQFLHDREELEQRLALDLRTASSQVVTSGHRTSSVTTMYWLGMMVSVAAVLLYLVIGSPSSIP